MAHKCYISFKTEDTRYKEAIQHGLSIDMIDKSLNTPINSWDPDYIMRRIREDYLADSTVTIHLIGPYGAEWRGWQEQQYIKRELQASLYDGDGNTRSGILGVVLPEMYDSIYRGSYACSTCSKSHDWVAVNDDTVVKEFSYNYYIPNNKCSHAKEDRYCILVRWDSFVSDPEPFIDMAYQKRFSPIATQVKVRP